METHTLFNSHIIAMHETTMYIKAHVLGENFIIVWASHGTNDYMYEHISISEETGRKR
jgi:hypothetical protein